MMQNAAALAAVNPWLGAGALAVDAINGGAPGTASGQSTSSFDSSGWNVNFGSGSIESKRAQETAGQMDAYLPYALIFVGAMIVWRMTKK